MSDRLAEPHEAQIIDDWFEHMNEVRARLAPGVDPMIIHWSPAEETWLETAWTAAVKRHPEKDWPHPNWFDFLTRVVREEPFIVRRGPWLWFEGRDEGHAGAKPH